MKFDIKNNKAPDIVVKFNGEEFKLVHRYLTGIERAAAVDSFNNGLGAAMVEWWSYMLAWSGVEDMEGVPLHMVFVHPDGKEDRSNFDKVIGRLPFIEQIRILLIQVAMNGIHLRKLKTIIRELVSDETEAERLIGEIDPFFLNKAAATSGEPSSIP